MKIIILNILLLFSFHSYSQKDNIKIKAVNDFEKLEITTSKNNKIQIINSIET